MVRERHHQRPVVGVLEGLPDDGVAAAIGVVDDRCEGGIGGLAAIGRVVGLGVAPEQVLDAVGRVEQDVEQPIVER